MLLLADLPKHQIKLIPGGDWLVFSFESAYMHDQELSRGPWGGKFLSEKGYSVAGVICKETEWYRCPDLHAQLEAMRDDGFFKRYRSTTFIGGSMGGFAALAFAELVPGCRVVAISPQSTLDPAVVPFETRFPEGRNQDWSGKYNDGAKGVTFSSQAFVMLDRHYKLDVMQTARLPSQKITHLNAPFLGHGLPATFGQMGVLKPVILSSVKGESTSKSFAAHMRKRRGQLKYKRHLSHRLAQSGHFEASMAVAKKFFRETKDEYFVAMMALTYANAGRIAEGFDLTLDRPFPSKSA